MREINSYLTVTLDLSEPVEIGDLAAFYSGLGAQFESFLKQNYPDVRGEAKIFVKEIRSGSIISDIFPNIPDLVGYMDTVLIVTGFASLISKRVRSLAHGSHIVGASKSDLQEVGKTIRALSNDTKGALIIASMKYDQGIWHKNIELKFSTSDARAAERTIEDQKNSIDNISHSDFSKVVMFFERSAKSKSDVLRPTGELVVIEEINSKPKSLIYASESAERIIKREIRESDDNIYKKGFIVDANVKKKEGKIIAYAITNVHQIIDLSED